MKRIKSPGLRVVLPISMFLPAAAHLLNVTIYGWWIVLIIAFALFLGPAPIMTFSYGVFLKALSRELRLYRFSQAARQNRCWRQTQSQRPLRHSMCAASKCAIL